MLRNELFVVAVVFIKDYHISASFNPDKRMNEILPMYVYACIWKFSVMIQLPLYRI